MDNDTTNKNPGPKESGVSFFGLSVVLRLDRILARRVHRETLLQGRPQFPFRERVTDRGDDGFFRHRFTVRFDDLTNLVIGLGAER